MKKIIYILLIAFTTNASYVDTVKSVQPANLIQYLPMQEASGSVAYDSSGNGRSGIYNNCVLNRDTGFAIGEKSVRFNGVNSYLSHISLNGFDTAFNRSEGSTMIWFYSNATPWGGQGTQGLKVIARIHSDPDNFLQLSITNENLAIEHVVAGKWHSKSVPVADIQKTGVADKWICIFTTWSVADNKYIVYANGSQVSKTLPFSGWEPGSVVNANTRIGAIFTITQCYFDGYLSHWAVWNKALTKDDIKKLSIVRTPSVVGFGDGIMYGQQATEVNKRFLSIFCLDMLKTPFFVNEGKVGSILQNTPAAVYGGISQAINGRDAVRSSVLDYNPDIVVISYGIEDMRETDPAINVTHFTNDYSEVIDSCKLNGVNDVYMNTIPYYTNYAQLGGTLHKHRQYNDSIISLSKRKDCKLANAYNFMQNMGGESLLAWGIYPNDSGHYVIAKADSTSAFLTYKKILIGKFGEN